MNLTLRNILATLAGLSAASITVVIFEAINGRIFPLPAGLDLTDAAGMRAARASLPLAALVIVAAGWALGAFAGGAVSTLIVRARRSHRALVFGVLFLGVTAMNLASLPHPVWMWIVGLLLPVPMSLLGARVVRGGENASG